MATTKKEISSWFDDGIKKGATHLIVFCDTFDYEDYPVFVMPSENVRAKATGGNMQTVMEVYNLKMDKALQLKQDRSFNY